MSISRGSIHIVGVRDGYIGNARDDVAVIGRCGELFIGR